MSNDSGAQARPAFGRRLQCQVMHTCHRVIPCINKTPAIKWDEVVSTYTKDFPRETLAL